MNTFDRIILIILTLGVWGMVLKPVSLDAHTGQYCEITSGSGWGELDGDEVYVYSLNGEVYCG